MSNQELLEKIKEDIEIRTWRKLVGCRKSKFLLKKLLKKIAFNSTL